MKDYSEGCGKRMGHNESCSKGWMCQSCEDIAEIQKENAALRANWKAINKSLNRMRKTVWNSEEMDTEMTEEFKFGAIWVFHCLELALEDIKENKK